MDNRKSKRLAIRLGVKLLAGSNKYSGTIENISMDGIFILMKTELAQSVKDFIPGTVIQVQFQPVQGKHIVLRSNVRWLHVNEEAPESLTYKVGAEILDPPADYTEWVKTIPAD